MWDLGKKEEDGIRISTSPQSCSALREKDRGTGLFVNSLKKLLRHEICSEYDLTLVKEKIIFEKN